MSVPSSDKVPPATTLTLTTEATEAEMRTRKRALHGAFGGQVEEVKVTEAPTAKRGTRKRARLGVCGRQ